VSHTDSHPAAGKTWAYLLPVIDKVLKIQEIQKKYHPKMHHGRKVYLVILVPSRLLGLQIMMELKSIEKHTGITSLLSHREKNNTPRLTMEQIKAGLANILITNLGRLQNLLTMDITEQSQVTKTLMKDDVRQDLLEEIFSQSMFASVKQVVLEEVGDLVGREAEVDTIKNLLARCQSDVKIVACSALRCESPRLQELLMSASPFPPPVHHVQQQYDGKDAMSLLDIDFTFKCVQDVKKSGVQWDYKFNQLQEIILKEDERTLIVSDSIEITEKSEQWISKISSNMKTALFHGNLPQEKFAANFQRFIIDETANIGCSTSKMTAGLNFNVDHVIIAELGKPRFLENEINTAMTNIGRTGRNKRKGRVTIIFNHHDKEIGEHLCAKLLEYFPDDSDLKAEVEKITRFFQIDIMQLLKDTFKNPAMPEDADNTWVVGESVNNPLDGVADVEGTGEKGDAEDDDDDDDDARFIAEQNAEEAAVGQDAEEAAVVQDAEEAAVGQNAEEAAVDAAAQAPPGGW
jgi:superfamily II DNA/RNA helicase